MTGEWYSIRPLDGWPEGETLLRQSSAVFRAGYRDTLALLRDELRHLEAERVVVQLDVREGDVRLDGMLRADAKVGPFPGVRVAFDSVHGPLMYATDAYENRGWGLPSWQANLRAIALGLKALRDVDRYGITRRGEQYTGWKALPTGLSMGATHMTTDEAWAVLYAAAEINDEAERRILSADPPGLLRRARGRAHPDRNGGNRLVWDQVEQAAKVLRILEAISR